jgi:sugar phosphate isomerase/epimerase
MPAIVIAVNIGSYGNYREGAFAHLERIGIRNVEIPVPALDQVEATQERLRNHGLVTTTLNCPCDLTADPEGMREKLEAGRRMGLSLYFISAKIGELNKPEAYHRLRARVELAAEYGITLSLETHPALGENWTEARATLHAVGHPNLRWNLDTANLYYYNANIDAVRQAEAGSGIIGSVHLKDTNGGYQCWWFPALGDGVVDFPGVFRVLNATGFYGPWAMELEGIQGEELDEAATQARVERSVQYLRRLGVLEG